MPKVVQINLENQTITPVTTRYIQRAIRQAEEEQAQCLLIVLDTPGGLVDSTRNIVQAILQSRVCVVVYVAPSGVAHAASAGGFITLSAHIAAMAPGTRIGAMHPVQIGGLPISPDRSPKLPTNNYPNNEEKKETQKTPSTPMTDKMVNDTVAWAKSLAELRGRNADWAERAVKESIVVTEKEALKEGIIDLVAEDVPQLLEKIDGRQVVLPQGTITLHTAGVTETQTIEMWWGERVLAAISNPNVAFMLLIFGFYGIMFEFYSPGWGVAGTLGIICLVMAFFGLAVLPINYVGLLLIALALGLFTAEVFVTSFGALALGGIICLVLGGLMLVDSPVGFTRISFVVLIPVAAATGAITIFLITQIVQAHRKKTFTGSEAMLEAIAVAAGDFSQQQDQYAGTVCIHGEYWNAISRNPVKDNQNVRIRNRDGLTLSVEPESVNHSTAPESS
ncbi:NfeD family protein [Gimesia algae]